VIIAGSGWPFASEVVLEEFSRSGYIVSLFVERFKVFALLLLLLFLFMPGVMDLIVVGRINQVWICSGLEELPKRVSIS